MHNLHSFYEYTLAVSEELNSWTIASVLTSFQTMKLWNGLLVDCCQVRNVPLCVASPMQAKSPAVNSAPVGEIVIISIMTMTAEINNHQLASIYLILLPWQL